MDPVVLDNKELEIIRFKIKDVLSKYDYILDIHDIRLVDGKHKKNIIFDVVFSNDVKKDEINKKYLKS
ncbi:hypothetical protein PL321_14030 [Caloramator sp. mosi_1]|uniref:hypothetical protein n=1 Tax=Caloramator sp. mosi_1 TaxID=3023090 RepID=UPI002362EED9|nr:hypothetical protein [Caloramator sp. mosi_1]WDC83687.1 hypothetical protein PL321_14030 [Caloramator sp. mosi_1]